MAQEATPTQGPIFVRPTKKIAEMTDEELLEWSEQVLTQIRGPRPSEKK